RYRATALIIRDGKILLVKDKGKPDYSMPGGRIEAKEQTLQTGIREVYEELKLRTIQATRLRYCDVIGKRANHKVCMLVVEGEPHIDRSELDSFLWWDMKQNIPLQGHVNFILNTYKSRNQ
ncbi:MAG: NUDIX domain-containing protein, partial [Dehalococcoidia bacterium]|nr:NUDIX domain-containing protein [Dehalococcoidia bacterium]